MFDPIKRLLTLLFCLLALSPLLSAAPVSGISKRSDPTESPKSQGEVGSISKPTVQESEDTVNANQTEPIDHIKRDSKKSKYETVKKQKVAAWTKDKKKERMGICLTLVPLTMGKEMKHYIQDFFDSDFVSQESIMTFWTESKAKNLEKDMAIDVEYIEKYTDIAYGPDDKKRRGLEDSTALLAGEADDHVQKRGIGGVLKIFGNLIKSGIKATKNSTNKHKHKGHKSSSGSSAGSSSSSSKENKNPQPSLKQGKGAHSHEEQMNAATKVRGSGNWDSCLNYENPSKNGQLYH